MLYSISASTADTDTATNLNDSASVNACSGLTTPSRRVLTPVVVCGSPCILSQRPQEDHTISPPLNTATTTATSSAGSRTFNNVLPQTSVPVSESEKLTALNQHVLEELKAPRPQAPDIESSVCPLPVQRFRKAWWAGVRPTTCERTCRHRSKVCDAIQLCNDCTGYYCKWLADLVGIPVLKASGRVDPLVFYKDPLAKLYWERISKVVCCPKMTTKCLMCIRRYQLFTHFLPGNLLFRSLVHQSVMKLHEEGFSVDMGLIRKVTRRHLERIAESMKLQLPGEYAPSLQAYDIIIRRGPLVEVLTNGLSSGVPASTSSPNSYTMSCSSPKALSSHSPSSNSQITCNAKYHHTGITHSPIKNVIPSFKNLEDREFTANQDGDSSTQNVLESDVKEAIKSLDTRGVHNNVLPRTDLLDLDRNLQNVLRFELSKDSFSETCSEKCITHASDSNVTHAPVTDRIEENILIKPENHNESNVSTSHTVTVLSEKDGASDNSRTSTTVKPIVDDSEQGNGLDTRCDVSSAEKLIDETVGEPPPKTRCFRTRRRIKQSIYNNSNGIYYSPLEDDGDFLSYLGEDEISKEASDVGRNESDNGDSEPMYCSGKRKRRRGITGRRHAEKTSSNPSISTRDTSNNKQTEFPGYGFEHQLERSSDLAGFVNLRLHELSHQFPNISPPTDNNGSNQKKRGLSLNATELVDKMQMSLCSTETELTDRNVDIKKQRGNSSKCLSSSYIKSNENFTKTTLPDGFLRSDNKQPNTTLARNDYHLQLLEKVAAFFFQKLLASSTATATNAVTHPKKLAIPNDICNSIMPTSLINELSHADQLTEEQRLANGGIRGVFWEPVKEAWCVLLPVPPRSPLVTVRRRILSFSVRQWGSFSVAKWHAVYERIKRNPEELKTVDPGLRQELSVWVKSNLETIEEKSMVVPISTMEDEDQCLLTKDFIPENVTQPFDNCIDSFGALSLANIAKLQTNLGSSMSLRYGEPPARLVDLLGSLAKALSTQSSMATD